MAKPLNKIVPAILEEITAERGRQALARPEDRSLEVIEVHMQVCVGDARAMRMTRLSSLTEYRRSMIRTAAWAIAAIEECDRLTINSAADKIDEVTIW